MQTVHVVFKTQREELQQLRNGMESISLLQFLQLCRNCVQHVFPLEKEVTYKGAEFFSLINKTWLRSLSGLEDTVMKWFENYVTEIDEGNSGNTCYNSQFRNLKHSRHVRPILYI